MDSQRIECTLQGLHALQREPLSIIRLSENVLPTQPSNRTSDASISAQEHSSLASLESDLNHYKELFGKLRFSYLEQVTKEKFLRAIISEPPQIANASENSALEEQLGQVKIVLKEQKRNAAKTIEELETQGRNLARQYEGISVQTRTLAELPDQISGLQRTLDELRKHNAEYDVDQSEHPDLRLGFDASQEILRKKQQEDAELDEQLQQLEQILSRQTAKLEHERQSLAAAERERDTLRSQVAKDTARNASQNQISDLEIQGRWLKSSELALRNLLDIEAH